MRYFLIILLSYSGFSVAQNLFEKKQVVIAVMDLPSDLNHPLLKPYLITSTNPEIEEHLFFNDDVMLSRSRTYA